MCALVCICRPGRSNVRENGGVITHTIGAILAGGSSSRMGREKAALTVEGTPFLNRIYETMSEVFSEVIVCGGSEAPSGGALIHDDRPGGGPVGGLLSALRIARGRSVFVTAVDMPLVTAEAIRSIVEPPVTGGSVRIAVVDGEDQPLVGVYGPRIEQVARARFDAGQRSALGLIDDIEGVERVVMDAGVLFNVNTVEDYAELTGRYAL